MKDIKAKYNARQRRGFSLVEVLIALGVFAVGFISVASMLPAAIILQKRTMLDLESKIVEQNVVSVIGGRRLTFSPTLGGVDLTPNNVPNENLTPFSQIASPMATKWKLPDRGYPTFMKDVSKRRFFWVPFVARNSEEDPANPPNPLPATVGDFGVLAFIQVRQPGKQYTQAATDYTMVANPADGPEVPKVVRIAITVAGPNFTIAAAESQKAKDHFNALEPGQYVADNKGNTYVIADVGAGVITVSGIVPNDVTHLWYGAPADDEIETSTVSIVTLAAIVDSVN